MTRPQALDALTAAARDGCYCEDCVDQERTAVGDTGSAARCLNCRSADAIDQLRADAAGLREMLAASDTALCELGRFLDYLPMSIEDLASSATLDAMGAASVRLRAAAKERTDD